MLTLDIVSDIVCPWCFIGLHRLEKALAKVHADRPELEITRRWQPFFLNPDTPPEGEAYLPFLIAKFGSRQAVDGLFERVRAAGAADGVDFAFEKITLRANTLQAHRLIYWAQQQGDATALVERLFVGQFQRGEHVGDRSVLTAMAAECAYSAESVARYLASDEDTEKVLAAAARFRSLGVNQVPTFVFNGRYALSGAEHPDTLAAAMLRALD